MPFNRTLTEIFRAHKDNIRDDIRVCLPATITAVHASKQTVDVQIAIKNPVFDEFGEVTFEEAPGLADVPLGVIRGGGFFVWVPVQVGDSVLVLFSDLSMDTWRAGQSGQGPTTPGWLGKHTLDSPVAIPLITPDASILTDPQSNKLVIGKDGSAAQIRISATDIELGNAVTDAVGLASKIDSAVSTIVNAFNLHTHIGVQTGAGTSGIPSPTSIIPSQPTTASNLVKAQ